LSRPIIARLRSESHQNDGITVRGRHQRLLQQNLPLADLCTAANGISIRSMLAVVSGVSNFIQTRVGHSA
jgi:hypothetical protein